MIVIVSENPDPMSLARCGTDIEIRMLIKGATDEEGESIGEGIRLVIDEARPGQKIKAFQMDGETVVG